jgi:hypothetical protein
MTTYTINENGLKTIESRINDLGLDWSVDGTAQEIWMKGDFDDDLNNNGYYDFEAVRSPQGHMETITITLDDVDAAK